MQRITITLDEELLDLIDRRVETQGYQGRSEAIRDLLRSGLREAEALPDEAPCVAVVSYLYDHASRELPKRLNQTLHAHHELTRSTLHVHLDAGRCLEVSVLQGPSGALERLSRQLTVERGVEHGHVHVLPAPRHGEGE
ncbi:nickel-responsive transcriptional regulator NikR [Pseudomonas juntendi]|jgi:CopG family nickel-responsive transcriptional regulator|uniref:Putative nickel-responsive regulator n=1 Tax=Pseudomonas juntendi TaxID=2666183 RepID=A0ABD4YDV2_9PSED|nr:MULTISPECIES: nickel-responsive transcriptional regulator NikR [Pseudomonas]MBH3375357.1 nickel-responsive transcriptional regulator NikR [Pseudomonas juntendi]MBS6037920.1 nickel-responsive transcriptional regulator NikR [Pseudomonas sp.]MDG9873042.1 nickel-responsive transcriptional regulator NikR [Pseudomonas juntendi]MDH0757432.1 nickel-responsive transcriptional regulator NikR [Pseudomonas juntendi]MDH1918374.1 nickel-responsive transcriptional regulator NikR [Pseudomonas juntendi]